MMKQIFLATLIALSLGSVFAKDAAPLADDPVTEQRLISEEMRCLVSERIFSVARALIWQNDLRREIRIRSVKEVR
jgi:cytochrome c-type biogenesis protein CcmH